MIRLRDALQITNTAKVAFVGAGGKTSALFHLARQIEGAVWVTASSHLHSDQLSRGNRHLEINDRDDLTELKEIPAEGITVITGPAGEDQRTAGISMEILAEISRLADRRQVPLLIEADGARRKPLKAPAEHEPPIPDFVDTVVVVAGLSALGQQLDEAVVHRSEIFAEISGVSSGEITPTSLSAVLTHSQGGLKNIPPFSRRIALLNQADSPELAASAKGIASDLLKVYQSVIVSRLESDPPEILAVYPRAAGIVLAAGGSTRLGSPKQLLEWRGKTFVRTVASTALEAGLSPVIVVLGAEFQAVQKEIADLPVTVVDNKDWESGQSSSVKAGLAALPDEVGAALFFLVDQPQIPASLPIKLLETHAATFAAIVAPEVDGRRGNPVLFDRRAFRDLALVEGDSGGRQVFSKHKVTWVPWVDPAAGLDVDTLHDYQKLLNWED